MSYKSLDTREFARTQEKRLKKINKILRFGNTPCLNSSSSKIKQMESEQKDRLRYELWFNKSIYSQYIIQILSEYNDPYIRDKYKHYAKSHNKTRLNKMDVYSRINQDTKRRKSCIPLSKLDQS